MNSDWRVAIPIVVCAGLSFLFSGMEAGVFALSRLRIRQMVREGRGQAALLNRLLEKPESFLWTILLGNALVNFVLAALGVMVLYQWLGTIPGLFVLSLFGATLLFYTFCDLLPKMMFRRFPHRLCLAVARPFRWIHLVMAPVVAVVDLLSRSLMGWLGGRPFTGHLIANREELRLFFQESSQALTPEERAIIARVLDLPDVTVEPLLVPLDRAVTVTTETSLKEFVELCREKNLGRIPVWQGEGDQRRIIGIASLKTILYRRDLDLSQPVEAFLKPALFLGKDTHLADALRRMQRSGLLLAVVLGDHQREIGLVSLQDILKFIFGEVVL